MTRAFPLSSVPIRLPLRRLLVATMLAVVLGMTVAAGRAWADPAPQQWLPTAADLIRTLRPCGLAVSAPVAPVCWSVAEDTSAWMAPPAGSPYPWGQCTYYAGLMRPDIWNDRAPPSADPLYDNWDAWTWSEHAQAEGLAVDGNPQPGDVMVYSRAAVGNATGHVTIVDAVQPSGDPAQVELTVSEMNVDELDDASAGQGDTMVVVVPRAQLVPGMIQFIHRPALRYHAPAWPAASPGGELGVAAPTAPASADPSLAIGLPGDQVETVSESTSPVSVTVTSLPGGAVVKQMSIPANRIVALQLPGGSYRVCVSQAPDGVWPAVTTCATGAWEVPPLTVRVRAGRVRAGTRRLTVPLAIQLSGAPAGPRVRAVAELVQRRAVAAGWATTARNVTLCRAGVELRSGRLVLRLAVAARALHRGVILLRLRIPAQTSSGYRVSAALISSTVR
jgi:surface antigen